jgi:uncharacterized protein YcbX
MRLSAITRYPIKSCRGIDVDRAPVTLRGIEDDRRWMIVDGASRVVTQREAPRLALVAVDLGGGMLRAHVPSSPEHAAISFPARLDEGERIAVAIWRTTVDAIVHRAASEWFSSFLGRGVRAVYMPDDVRRPINPRFARDGDAVSFADGYPLLLASESSRRDLDAQMPAPLPMSRYRPNVVLDGAPPWIEETFRAIRIGAIPFRVPKPCERCVITTIDPETAIAGKEPLRTLASYRRRGGEVLFGVNLIPDVEGTIAVGDPIVVLD